MTESKTTRKSAQSTEVFEPEQHSTLAAALAAFQSKLPSVGKDKTAQVPTKSGGNYSYSYADLASVSSVVLPLLARQGLAFTCTPTQTEHGWAVVGQLLHAHSGESVTGALPFTAAAPQQMGSAITYARRYLLGALTGAVTDEDDDGAQAQRYHENVQQPAQQQQRRAQRTAQRQQPQQPPQVDPEALGKLRRDVLDLVAGFEPGPDRDDALRSVHERAAKLHALDAMVELPSAWRDDPETTHVPMRALIGGARGMTTPADETSDDDPWGSTLPGVEKDAREYER